MARTPGQPELGDFGSEWGVWGRCLLHAGERLIWPSREAYLAKFHLDANGGTGMSVGEALLFWATNGILPLFLAMGKAAQPVDGIRAGSFGCDTEYVCTGACLCRSLHNC